MWILGLEKSLQAICAQRQCHAISRPLRAYRVRYFIHTSQFHLHSGKLPQECLQSGVQHITAALLKASFSQQIPACSWTKTLSVAAGSGGAQPPQHRRLLTPSLHPSESHIRAGSAGCEAAELWTPPASPAASFVVEERPSRWRTHHRPQAHLGNG